MTSNSLSQMAIRADDLSNAHSKSNNTKNKFTKIYCNAFNLCTATQTYSKIFKASINCSVIQY